ncbi:MAG TPA: dihydropteroate synthase [Vineibacter sp.]|nr:dihydropteroate synthase [Vineibacter sp.]
MGLATTIPPFAGLQPHADGRPWVMGILNVTPDSFSDGGLYLDPGRAIEAGLQLRDEGADVVDVGGESTRPGALSLSVGEETARVVPVIQRLADAGIVVSVDSRRAAVMQAALDAGARLVNDVSALCDDPAALPLIATRACPVILMHRSGTADTGYVPPEGDVVTAAKMFLAVRIAACLAAGIAREAIAVDPGLGFVGGAPETNLALIAGIPDVAAFGYPVVIGASRKRFVGAIVGESEPARRLGGSLALALAAADRGAAILRVHDVRDTVQALKAQAALRSYQLPQGSDGHGL